MPKIDYSFPKSKYPFFAMSFYNLIPACQTCNESPNKGIFDPYSIDLKESLLMHPYSFDESKFEFEYTLNGIEMFNDDNYSSSINYKGNNHLKSGYNDIIGIEPLYEGEKAEVRKLWNLAYNANQKRIEFAQKVIDIPNQYFTDPEKLIGFEFNEYNSRRHPKYKFDKDILIKMLSDLQKK